MFEKVAIYNLSVSINGKRILNDISTTFERGKIYSIIGPSGSGKTTFLKSIAGSYSLERGEVFINDVNALDVRCKKIDKKYFPDITFVNQKYTLWPHFSIRKNIELPLFNFKERLFLKYIEGRKSKRDNYLLKLLTTDQEAFINRIEIKREKIAELASLVDIEWLLDKMPDECSGGEQQRASLVRHISINPKVLILDEITSALDVEQVLSLKETLKIISNQGVIIILSTHLLSFAKDISDRIIFLDKGNLIEQGSPEILETPQSERLIKFMSIFS